VEVFIFSQVSVKATTTSKALPIANSNVSRDNSFAGNLHVKKEERTG